METVDPNAHAVGSLQSSPTIVQGGQHPVIVGRYRILERIADGGMGTVYKAEQREPVVRIVALKVVKLGMDSVAVISRFNAERQALAMMDHPNIAKVLDAGTTELGRPYFVMEYVPGEPITTYCDRHKLTTAERLQLFAPVCEAVQHAHQKGIIHRDLKPSNILITVREGKPVSKVIDFGVAKATAHKLTETTLFTEAGQLIGTPEYMSPEQAEMTGLDVDTRSDVYSLGVVLYELLTGALPFDPKTLRLAGFAEIQRIIRDVDPPRPSTRFTSLTGDEAKAIAERRQIGADMLARDLRRELEWIPLKAMHKDRTRRYRTATDLSDDLANYLSGQPLNAAPDSAVYRINKLLRRNKATVAVSAAVVPVVVVGIAGASAAVLFLLGAGFIGTVAGLVGQVRLRGRADQQRMEAEKQTAEAERQKANAQREREEADRQRARAVEQEQEAKKQASIAEAVVRFQNDMLASADPNKVLGDKVSVLDAVMAAEQELERGKLRAEPLVEAAVRATIGETLHQLGRFESAERSLRRALDIRRDFLPPDHLDIAAVLDHLAYTLRDGNKAVESERLYREELDIRRRALPAGRADLAMALNNFGLLLWDQGKLDDAESHYREALDFYRQALPIDHPNRAECLNNLALVLKDQNKLDEAGNLFRDALAVWKKALPPGHPFTAAALNNWARVKQLQNKFGESEQLYREALEIRRKALPAGHPLVAMGLNNLARLLHAQQKNTEAEPMFRESLEMFRKALPPGHPDAVFALNGLGQLLHDLNRPAEAEALLREALAIRRSALSSDHALVALSLNNLGQFLVSQGKSTEAEPLLREALTIRRKCLPAGHPDVGASVQNLASMLLAAGRIAEADVVAKG